MVAWRQSFNILAAKAFLAADIALLAACAVQDELSASLPRSDPYPYILKSSFSLSPSLADEWQVQEHLPPSGYLMDLRFSFRPQPENTQILEDILFSNHPSDPLWTHRKHLSKDEVARLVAPHRHSIERFQLYLARHGVDSNSLVYSKGDVSRSIAILPRVSVQLAERLLGTHYRVYKNTKTGREIVRATKYSLPADIHGDIDWVQPTNYFGKVTAHRRTLHIEPPSFSKELSNGVSAATNVTLSFLKDLYNFANFTPTATSSTSQNLLGVTGYAVHKNNINSSTPQHGFLGT
jgi:tripeptidyl-peptidase-1